MKVRYSSRAHSIIDYLNERNPHAARNVGRALDTTMGLIGRFPDSGRRVGDVRVLPVGPYPYLIYWTVVADDVWILHIRDGRRRPWRTSR
jgi:plasmid stabilization system protein ParE